MDHCQESLPPKRRRRRRFLGRVAPAGAPVPGPADPRDRSYVYDGERSLRRAVLHDAVMTMVKNARAARPRARRLYAEASEWVAENDASWPFSFVNVCDALDLSVSRVRSAIDELVAWDPLVQRDAPDAPAPRIVTWPDDDAERGVTGYGLARVARAAKAEEVETEVRRVIVADGGRHAARG